LAIAAAVTLIAAVVGIPAGRALGLHDFRGKAVAEGVILAPLIVPPLTVALAQFHPARLSYTLFSDRNPWMIWVRSLAPVVQGGRRPVAADNAGRVAERSVSQAIEKALSDFGRQRDAATERMFREVYGAPFVQALMGVGADSAAPRLRPTHSPDHQHFVTLAAERLRAMMSVGGLHEAAIRALLWIRMPTGAADERGFAVIRRIRAAYGADSMPLQDFKRIIRQQFFMLLIDEPAALAALPALLPADPAARDAAFATISAVVTAVGEIPPAVAERLHAIGQVFTGGEVPAGDGKGRPLRPPRRAAASAAAPRRRAAAA
jgi:hypothetical protein